MVFFMPDLRWRNTWWHANPRLPITKEITHQANLGDFIRDCKA